MPRQLRGEGKAVGHVMFDPDNRPTRELPADSACGVASPATAAGNDHGDAGCWRTRCGGSRRLAAERTSQCSADRFWMYYWIWRN